MTQSGPIQRVTEGPTALGQGRHELRGIVPHDDKVQRIRCAGALGVGRGGREFSQLGPQLSKREIWQILTRIDLVGIRFFLVVVAVRCAERETKTENLAGTSERHVHEAPTFRTGNEHMPLKGASRIEL